MNIQIEKYTEEKLSISETDIVNGGEVLVLVVYATQENSGVWSFPAPQVFNKELYEKYKTIYDEKIKEFRMNYI